MSLAHEAEVVESMEGGFFKAICSCGDTSKVANHQWEVEDWVLNHYKLVQRVRTHLSRQPTLKQSRDYYAEQAQNEENDEASREMWQALADEITHRLNEQQQQWTQPTLEVEWPKPTEKGARAD